VKSLTVSEVISMLLKMPQDKIIELVVLSKNHDPKPPGWQAAHYDPAKDVVKIELW
jgi:hypothetical protein